jgi:uncharacterized membrane protein
MATIRNPVEWTSAQLVNIGHAMASTGRSLSHIGETAHSPMPAVGRIAVADLRDVFAKAWADFGAFRSDVIFICAVYPAVGLVLARLIVGDDMLPLVFPLASGFALIGPFAAVGLYEMSRRRERGLPVTWANVFDVVRAPAAGAILVLGLLLAAALILWLAAAWGIYDVTLGPAAPASVAGFIHGVFFTGAGWTMIIVGIGVGAFFAIGAATVGIVAFPLLLDRDCGLDTAIRTSIRAVAANPGPMVVWGLIVAAGLVIGSIPLFVGLIVVLPVLGHATWHLYRKLVQ